MITLLYNMYIEHEIYNMAYNKVQNIINDYKFIERNISKWDDSITVSEILRNKRY